MVGRLPGSNAGTVSVYRVTGSESFSNGELVGRNAFFIFATVFLSRCRSGLLAAGTPLFRLLGAISRDDGACRCRTYEWQSQLGRPRRCVQAVESMPPLIRIVASIAHNLVVVCP